MRFLKGRLSSVPTTDGRRALLGILVERGVDPSKWREWQWYSNLRAQCDNKDDRELLHVAEKAAALAAICRAVYAALCEVLCDDDGLDPGHARRGAVGNIVERYRDIHAATEGDRQMGEIAADADALLIGFKSGAGRASVFVAEGQMTADEIADRLNPAPAARA